MASVCRFETQLVREIKLDDEVSAINYRTRRVKVVDVNCTRVLVAGIDDAWRVI